VDLLHELGSTPSQAASSCAEILENNRGSISGYYWVTNGTGHPHSVYCDMTRSCGGVTGGWMRVAYLDMTNRTHQCPSGLRQRTDSGVRSCAPYSDSATCSSVLHRTHNIQYSNISDGF
jgi:dynein heavy chain